VEFSDQIDYTIADQGIVDEDPDLRLLYTLIQELNEIDKAIILLYLDQSSQKDISEVLGLSTTNISTRISRIKKRLRLKFSQAKSTNDAH
jgi:RNA polymerase sigma-70 factor (ECF subfamily)